MHWSEYVAGSNQFWIADSDLVCWGNIGKTIAMACRNPEVTCPLKSESWDSWEAELYSIVIFMCFTLIAIIYLTHLYTALHLRNIRQGSVQQEYQNTITLKPNIYDTLKLIYSGSIPTAAKAWQHSTCKACLRSSRNFPPKKWICCPSLLSLHHHFLNVWTNQEQN